MKRKEVGIAYICWAMSFIGLSGLHRFYIGKIGTGILFLLTAGLFGFGTIYDAFTLSGQVKEANGTDTREPVQKERSNSNYI